MFGGGDDGEEEEEEEEEVMVEEALSPEAGAETGCLAHLI